MARMGAKVEKHHHEVASAQHELGLKFSPLTGMADQLQIYKYCIWDRGTYDTVPSGQQHAMLEKGHLHVRLFGEKLIGDWHIVRTGRRGGDDGAGGSGKAVWLFFKAKDAHANPSYDVVAEQPSR